MNWKNEAAQKLQQLEAMKRAVESIPLEIRRLEGELQSIRSAGASEICVRGSGGRRDDAYLSNIVCRQELQAQLENARQWVELVQGGLEVLSDEQKLVLEKFYILPRKGAAETLAGELAMDVKTVYRRKDEALRLFTIALYGGIEN